MFPDSDKREWHDERINRSDILNQYSGDNEGSGAVQWVIAVISQGTLIQVNKSICSVNEQVN